MMLIEQSLRVVAELDASRIIDPTKRWVSRDSFPLSLDYTKIKPMKK